MLDLIHKFFETVYNVPELIRLGGLFGIVLEGHWLTVGTPEAIGEAEEAIRRFQTGA